MKVKKEFIKPRCLSIMSWPKRGPNIKKTTNIETKQTQNVPFPNESATQ